MTTLHILAALFLAYGAYLAIYGKQLRRKPEQPQQNPPAARDRRSHVRRRADRLAARPAGLPAPQRHA